MAKKYSLSLDVTKDSVYYSLLFSDHSTQQEVAVLQFPVQGVAERCPVSGRSAQPVLQPPNSQDCGSPGNQNPTDQSGNIVQ